MTELKKIIIPGTAENEPLIIAGPCSAESREQVMTTARGLKKEGVKILRAGIWKPRTKPGGFEGVGSPGLDWLAAAKAETGMLTATEVAMPVHVREALDSGVDILWIGARTSANPFAMQDIADTLREFGKDVPVLVKNPVNPDLELWIGAMQRLHNAGFHRLAAVHRGFSSYGQHIYRNNPQWHIPVELRRRYPDLPLLCDPSHIGGKRELIASISQQAFDMGYDGLMIESHCNPDTALSDKDQQVTPPTLGTILKSLVRRKKNFSSEEIMQLRREIDGIDNDILEILSRRLAVCREIGQFKKAHKLTVLQSERYSEMQKKLIDSGTQLGLDGDFISKLLSLIHEESVRQQLELFKRPGE